MYLFYLFIVYLTTWTDLPYRDRLVKALEKLDGQKTRGKNLEQRDANMNLKLAEQTLKI